jgi:hypothetical protein
MPEAASLSFGWVSFITPAPERRRTPDMADPGQHDDAAASCLDAQLRRDAGISHFEYEVLAAQSEAPERTLRMSDLAVLAEGSLSQLSQVVALLEKKKWVRRTPDPPTAATPWRSSPTTAGTRSSPPHPVTSTKFADSSSTHSPTPSSTS